MIPLRDDFLVALNEAIASLEEAANLYDTAARQLADSAVPAQFAALSAQRARMAATLKGMVQAREDVPSPPPSEQLMMQAALTRLKSLWAASEIDAFVADIEAREQSAIENLGRAAALADKDSSQRLVRAYAEEIEKAVADLHSEGA